MANELLVERKVYRIMANITNKLWHKIAWWTTANSVDAEDGRSLETKVGAINGITDSLTSTSSNIAASAKTVNTLNNNLMVYDNTFTMYTDECIANAISSWWQGEKVFFNINAQYSKNLEAGSWYHLLTFNKKPNRVFHYPCVYNYDKAGLAKINTDGVFCFRPSGDAYLSGQPVIVDGIYHSF